VVHQIGAGGGGARRASPTRTGAHASDT
jgi:hypothetical protein